MLAFLFGYSVLGHTEVSFWWWLLAVCVDTGWLGEWEQKHEAKRTRELRRLQDRVEELEIERERERERGG